MTEFSKLLDQARSGDREALSALYERHRASVSAVLTSRLMGRMRSRYETADLEQSVFADVIAALPKFEDRGEPAFRSWLQLKARNKLRDKIRTQLGRRRQRVERTLATSLVPEARVPQPDEIAADEESAARVRELVSELDPETADLVLFRVAEGLPFADLASLMGLPSADAARMRYARALTGMRRSWKTRNGE